MPYSKYGTQQRLRSEFFNLGKYTSLSDAAFRLLLLLNCLADPDGNVDTDPIELAARFLRSPDELPVLFKELQNLGHIRRYDADGYNGTVMVGYNEDKHPNYQPRDRSSFAAWRNPRPSWQDGPINPTQRKERTPRKARDGHAPQATTASRDDKRRVDHDDRRGVPAARDEDAVHSDSQDEQSTTDRRPASGGSAAVLGGRVQVDRAHPDAGSSVQGVEPRRKFKRRTPTSDTQEAPKEPQRPNKRRLSSTMREQLDEKKRKRAELDAKYAEEDAAMEELHNKHRRNPIPDCIADDDKKLDAVKTYLNPARGGKPEVLRDVLTQQDLLALSLADLISEDHYIELTD